MKTRKVNLGVITLGNSAMVSDPCYGLYTWCNKIITDICQGAFDSFVRIGKIDKYEYVTELTLCKANRKPFTALKHLEHYTSAIGVDSGTCGIYDYEYFKENHCELESKDDWYKKNVCNGFYDTKNQAFITDDKGVHSCSGYGDGMYHCYVKRNENGKIIQITIKYIL